ncbi:unnamed protein product, partial [Choristocarpus tenellus]
KVFRLNLSPPELGAAIHLFDKDGDGTISCPEFLITFFRIGFDTRQEAAGERKRQDRENFARIAEENAQK